jgi:hypothetical protein
MVVVPARATAVAKPGGPAALATIALGPRTTTRLVRRSMSFVRPFFQPHEPRDSSLLSVDPVLAPDDGLGPRIPGNS